MYKHTDWPYWYHKAPFGSGHQVLKDRILGAYLECQGQMSSVFKTLNLAPFSFYNYVRLLGLGSQIKAMRAVIRNAFRKAAADAEGKTMRPEHKQKYSHARPEARPASAITSVAVSSEDSGVWSV